MNLSDELKSFAEIITFRKFTEKLVPDTNYPMLGVRVPNIKKIAKNAVNNGVTEDFLKEKHVFYGVPHFDQMQKSISAQFQTAEIKYRNE